MPLDEEQVEEPVEEQAEEQVEEVESDDLVPDDPNLVNDLTAEELKEAGNLYKLLKDKTQQKNVVRILAQQAGLLDNVETPRQQQVAKKDIKTLVAEKLGTEYAFFTDKLSEVITAVLENERSYVDEKLNVSAQKEVERETTSALERLAKETKGESRKFEARMIKLMDRIKPSESLSTYDYFSDLYTLAAKGKVAASTKAQLADKINRNANNAADRLQGRGTGQGGTPGGPDKKGLRASVEYALKQMGMEK